MLRVSDSKYMHIKITSSMKYTYTPCKRISEGSFEVHLHARPNINLQ